MPTTPQVNTQQILQMGAHVEKVQQTIQSLPNVTAQQLNKERETSDEINRTQVQRLEKAFFIEKTDPKTGAKKRVRVLQNKKGGQKWTKKESDRNMPLEKYQGGIINIQA